MAINFNLAGARKQDPSDDPMNRDWVGYRSEMTEDEVFERNRGVWVFDPDRVEHERYATFSYRGKIVAVAAITGVECLPWPDPRGRRNRYAVVGRVLRRDDPIREYFIGRVIEIPTQNPVRYLDDGGRYEAEPARQRVRSGKPPSELPSQTTVDPSPPRRPLRRRPARWVARPVSELPSSRLEWAREWFDRLGVAGESNDYLAGVEGWRAAWRPREIKALLVAESHVAQLDGDDRVSVRTDAALNVQRALPGVYVRLIYCLGYGNDAVCYPRAPANNDGTRDFWEIFERVATTGKRHAGQPLPLDQTQRQVAILERLADRGIWLEDASPIGLYLPGAGCLADSSTDDVIAQEGWSGYVWPKFAADPPKHIWVIGRTVRRALGRMDGITRSRSIMQPSYARRRGREGMWERYQAELDEMARQLASAAP
jgi:hypothetical protein